MSRDDELLFPRSPRLAQALKNATELYVTHEKGRIEFLSMTEDGPATLVEKPTKPSEAEIQQKLTEGFESHEVGILKPLNVRKVSGKLCTILMPKSDLILKEIMPKLQSLQKSQSSAHQKIILDFLWDMFAALLTLKNHQVLHRDIKPENIGFYHDLRTFILIDFGISSMGSLEIHKRSMTFFPGYTPQYAAPEFLNPNKLTSTFAADSYSIGVILFQMINQPLPDKTVRAQSENCEAALSASSDVTESLALFARWLTKEEPRNRPTWEQFDNAMTKIESLFNAANPNKALFQEATKQFFNEMVSNSSNTPHPKR